MNIYVDFEANAITQEIISIGAVTEEGATFYSLVRPHTKIDHKIKELTGITQENADIAPSIEEVMADFFAWILVQNGGDWTNPNFMVFGSHDREFINGSLAFVTDEVTRERLNLMWQHIDNIAGRISKKFRQKCIGLRSAYLTMRLAFDESAVQDHNALNDALMLKWVWEHIDEYELPEGVEPVRIKKPDLRYGGKKKRITSDGRIYDYDINDDHYYIPFTVVGKNRRGQEKEWHFQNVKHALTLFHPKKLKTNQAKIIVMDKILHALEMGEKLDGKVLTSE